jgi:DnaK suppressor protein
MTKEKIKHYKKLLIDEKQSLINEIIESDESARDLLENDSNTVNDSIDIATSTVAQNILNAMNSNNQQRMQAIEAALRRIEEGSFGICVICGKQILASRLEAVPWATKCMSCKVKSEKKGNNHNH